MGEITIRKRVLGNYSKTHSKVRRLITKTLILKDDIEKPYVPFINEPEHRNKDIVRILETLDFEVENTNTLSNCTLFADDKRAILVFDYDGRSRCIYINSYGYVIFNTKDSQAKLKLNMETGVILYKQSLFRNNSSYRRKVKVDEILNVTLS
jgi:hypothetical protein